MANQNLLPQTKYELLIDDRQSRWKVQLFFLKLVCLIIAVLFVTKTWLGFVELQNSTETIVGNEGDNAQIILWLRRIRIYAEWTEKNQNIEENTNFILSYNSESHTNGQLLVCYYTIPNYINMKDDLDPLQIDPHICTHIIVGFASITNCTLDLGNDTWVYKAVANLKNREPKLKVMVSAGGMNELQNGFPEMVINHANRKKFIRSVLNITKAYGLDGLDLDWEFPAWLSTDKRQKIHFVQLVQELRKEFDRSGQKLILSVAVAAPQAIIDQSYNIPEIAEHVDFINLMSYDYHYYTWYLPITNLNAPLYPRSDETGYASTLNVNFSANYWEAKGMPKEKIVVGIPTYGHSYKLINPSNHGLLAPAKSFGILGMLGFVSYGDICNFLKNNATSVFEEESYVPYVFKNTEWVSYDDQTSVYYKAKWIQENNFKGAMVFSLNSDDWNSTCNSTETFLLTRTIFSVFNETRLNKE